MADGWSRLPSELLLMVMSYMSAKDLARTANVNYHWRRVSEDGSLWKKLLIRDFKIPGPVKLKNRNSWIEEYKLLKCESPVVLCEDLRDCSLGLDHVSFSPNGLLFCTTANDGSFKVWTATTPTYLVHERYLGRTLRWTRALFSQFSPDSNNLLVCGLKSEGGGEVAVFSVDSQECEVHFLCRAPNNPENFLCCWYDNSHILCGDVYFFSQRSVIGTSASQIYLCSTKSPWNHSDEAFLCPILRLLNRRGGLCHLIMLGRYIPPRLRGVALLAEGARSENKTLTAKAQELSKNLKEGPSEEEMRGEMRSRLEQLLKLKECSCSKCLSCHENTGTECPLCYCDCHNEDDRLLIYAYGDTDRTPPHSVALTIVNGEKVSQLSKQKCSVDRGNGMHSVQEERREPANVEDQLSSILALFDLPDYIIDMEAYVTGFTLSLNHRFLFVNVVNDHFDNSLDFSRVAEIRLINLETLLFEGSYFGHFANLLDRFHCSVGGNFLTSASLEGGHVWSTDHHCLVGKLNHLNGSTAVAAEPINGEMVVSVGRTDGRIKIWRCKKYLHNSHIPNDFM